MTILVAVVVYQRWHNAERWKRVWASTERPEQLAIIHNIDGGAVRVAGDNPLIVERPNGGLDIGTLQDAIKGRLPLPEWDWLFWCPDDFLPMQIDFLAPFKRLMSGDNVGLIGSRPSAGPDIAEHCRTGGFMIRRDVAERLEFPADPITDCHQCGHFEFKSHNMLRQVRDMGFEAVFLNENDKRVIWDSHHEGWENRLHEFPCQDINDIFQFYGTDKWSLHSYGPLYDTILKPYRQTAQRILEIGVQNGFSLRAWRDYFHQADIHGVDVNPAAMIINEPRIRTHLCDVRHGTALTRIAQQNGPFDVIVDDGSHEPADMLQAYAVLRNYLAPNGLYVIEDIPTPEALDMFRQWPGAECHDRRHIKGRADDMLAILRS